MFCYIVLHDFIISMGVNANVWIMGEAEVHDAAEYIVNFWITGNTMDYMIRMFIIKPLSFVDLGISGFGGW